MQTPFDAMMRAAIATVSQQAMRTPLLQERYSVWCASALSAAESAIADWRHGDLPQWQRDIDQIKHAIAKQYDFDVNSPAVSGEAPPNMLDILQRLKPWRKGPFDLYGTCVDGEWRCDQKWNRFASDVVWQDKTVLDIGSGNGYYGLRALGLGADWVLGVDPSSRYLMQASVLWHLMGQPRNYVLPFRDDAMDGFKANIVLSMGVLYHNKGPLEHLLRVRQAMTKGGHAIIETYVVPGNATTVLVPEARYAKMRNVWMIPSVAALVVWLRKAGFTKVDQLDLTVTDDQEQRTTEWTGNASLNDFLTEDGSATVEGYPRPMRVVMLAR